MKTANVAEAVKSEHAVALLKQMYGENRVEENAARYQLVADGFAKEFGDKAFEFSSAYLFLKDRRHLVPPSGCEPLQIDNLPFGRLPGRLRAYT